MTSQCASNLYFLEICSEDSELVIFQFFKGNTLNMSLCQQYDNMIIPESSLLRGLLVRSHSIFDGPKHPVQRNDLDREKARTSGPSLGGVERTSPNTGWRLREGSSKNGGVEVHHFIYGCFQKLGYLKMDGL